MVLESDEEVTMADEQHCVVSCKRGGCGVGKLGIVTHDPVRACHQSRGCGLKGQAMKVRTCVHDFETDMIFDHWIE